MQDVIVAGAGPAGAVAALVLARAGVRVLVVDRETFPRDKLCGDTLNPGAVALLERLGLDGGPVERALRLDGMLVSGPRASVRVEYGGGVTGRALRRRDLDAWLLDGAVAAGARFEGGAVVRAPLATEDAGRVQVRGVVLSRRGQPSAALRVPAMMTIAADGRRSVLARALGLSSCPPRPRRWAYGTYATDVEGIEAVGEMHIRPGGYFGIAPLGGGLVNVCAVTGSGPRGLKPLELVRQAAMEDRRLAPRFASARFEAPVSVLGPLAIDVRAQGVPGLLLAGDAAGFVDPMTGDGLHLAMQSGVQAALETIAALEANDPVGAVARLGRARQDALGRKLRFNRWLRRLVESRAALEVLSVGARLAPVGIRRLVRYAGDAA